MRPITRYHREQAKHTMAMGDWLAFAILCAFFAAMLLWWGWT